MCVPLGSLPSHFAIAALISFRSLQDRGPLRGAVDVDDGLRVTVHDNGGTDTASDGGKTPENLLLAGS